MTASGTPRSEADVVLALRTAGCVFAEDEAAILMGDAATPADLDEMVERRIAGEPLEVIVGWAGFRGLRVGIDRDVFVPRQRTEFLVELAIQLAPPRPVVVDLCCGSGALGLAVRSAIPETRLFASDIEPAAVACAERNLAGVGEVFEGDLFSALPGELRGAVDILLVNAPYVPTAEIERMPAEARDYEPLVALDGGCDGLDIHRRVAAEALEWLARGGAILIETSEGQAATAVDFFERDGLTGRIEYSEEYDATVVVGVRR